MFTDHNCVSKSIIEEYIAPLSVQITSLEEELFAKTGELSATEWQEKFELLKTLKNS